MLEQHHRLMRIRGLVPKVLKMAPGTSLAVVVETPRKTPRFHCRGHGFDPWSGN